MKTPVIAEVYLRYLYAPSVLSRNRLYRVLPYLISSTRRQPTLYQQLAIRSTRIPALIVTRCIVPIVRGLIKFLFRLIRSYAIRRLVDTIITRLQPPHPRQHHPDTLVIVIPLVNQIHVRQARLPRYSPRFEFPKVPSNAGLRSSAHQRSTRSYLRRSLRGSR